MRTVLIATATFLLATLGFILSVVSLFVSPLLTYFSTGKEPSDVLEHKQLLRRRLFPKEEKKGRRRHVSEITISSFHKDSLPSVETLPQEPGRNVTMIPIPDSKNVPLPKKSPVLRAGVEWQTDVPLLPHCQTQLQRAHTTECPSSARPLPTGSGNGPRFPHFSRVKRSSSTGPRVVSAYEPLFNFKTLPSSQISPSTPMTGLEYSSNRAVSRTPSCRSSQSHFTKEKMSSLSRRSTLKELKAAVCAHPPESPPPRTRPYEAPYYFPHPGSHEAVGYVQRAREDLKIDPALVLNTAPNSVGKRKGHNRSVSHESSLKRSPSGQNVVIDEVGKSQMESMALIKPNEIKDERRASVDETKNGLTAGFDGKNRQKLKKLVRRH